MFVAVTGLGATERAASPLKILSQSGNAIRAVVSIDSAAFSFAKNSAGQVQPEISGFANWALPGQIALPRRVFLFGLPPEAKPQILVLRTVVSIHASDAPFVTVPEIREKKFGSQFNVAQLQHANSFVQLGESGYWRNQFVVGVIVTPVQLDPDKAGQIRFAREIEFALHWENAPSPEHFVPESGSDIFESLYEKTIVNYQTARHWRSSVTSNQYPVASNPKVASGKQPTTSIQDLASGIRHQASSPTDRVKIFVNANGIYRITATELRDAGLNLIGTDPHRIRMTNRGREIPIIVTGSADNNFDEKDAVLFHGSVNPGRQTMLSPYSETNVYWLFSAPGLGTRYVSYDAGLYEKNAARILRPKTFRQKLHIERDNAFDRLLLVTDTDADHWFWATLKAGETTRLNFALPGFMRQSADDSARLTVALMGSTHLDQNPDHSTRILINGAEVANVLWDGQTEKIIKNLGVAPALLRTGNNELGIHLPSDSPAGQIDQQFFNWHEIEYSAAFQAQSDGLDFTLTPPPSSAVAEITLSNFTKSNIFLIDSRGRQLVNGVEKRENGYYTFTFQDRLVDPQVTYHAFALAAAKSPQRIELDRTSDWRSPRHGADMLVVTHRDFINEVKPLVEWRRSRGLRVSVIEVEDIYDEFGDGLMSPEAIRDFVAYAFQSWQRPAPAFLLLVGDAHYGYEKQVTANWPEKTYVPTKFVYTISWGITSSDHYFVAVSGNDRLPDLNVGRLPVNSPSELKTVVDKILAYEKNPDLGDWRHRLAMLVGNLEFFEFQADYLDREIAPDQFKLARVYTNPSSKYFGKTEQLVDLINSGTVVMNFIGHGGGGVFEDSGLFKLEHIALLNNANRLPVLLSWSCFIGYFDNPFTPSLSEAMLREPNRGIVAAFGSSGRAFVQGDFFFNTEFFRRLFREQNPMIGEVVTAAKAEMLLNYGAFWDLPLNYNLLGDPAMRMGFPRQTLKLSVVNPALAAGESVVIKGTLPSNSGNLLLEVTTPDDSVLAFQRLRVNSSSFTASLPLPASYFGDAVARVYFAYGQQDAAGAGRFTVARPFVTSFKTDPEAPIHQQAFYFTTQLALPQKAQLDSIRVHWTIDNAIWSLLPVNDLGNGRYRTRQPLAFTEGQALLANVLVDYKENGKSKRYESPVQTFRVRRRAELAFAITFPKIDGTSAGNLRAQVVNYGELASGDFTAVLYSGQWPGANARLLKRQTFTSIEAGQTATLTFNWTPVQPGTQFFTIVLNPDTTLDESLLENNRSLLQVNLVTPSQGSGAEFYSSDSLATVSFPPRTLSQVTPVALTLHGADPQMPPQSLQKARLKNGSTRSYLINGLQDTLQLNGTIRASLAYDRYHPELRAAARQKRLRIFLYGFASRTWLSATTSIDTISGFARADLPEPGIFSLFSINDSNPPNIDVVISGHSVTNGDMVAEQPQVSATLADDSGIDLRPGVLRFLVDDQALEPTAYNLQLADTEAKIVTLTVVPRLTSGTHRLRIEATDRIGNPAAKEFQVRVQSSFVLQALANHPNPFAGSTVIAYTLTQPAQEVSLRIYTVAGRLIRELKYFDEVGYVEHEWDGTDEAGVEVANGVYYLRFVARRGDERIERIEKMARLR